MTEKESSDNSVKWRDIWLAEAWALYDYGRKAEALDRFYRLAEKGDPWSYYNYGVALFYEEDERAVDAFERSGDLGMFSAYATIGIALLFGYYIEKNRARSYGFLEKAAMRGHLIARIHMLRHFENSNIFKRIASGFVAIIVLLQVLLKNDENDERLYCYPFYPRPK
jgi:TPR repeat protein